MRINLASLFVDDQDRALRFYTEVLGFQLKHDIPAGDFRWITVVSPENPDGVELVLEPSAHPAAPPFKAACTSARSARARSAPPTTVYCLGRRSRHREAT